MHLINNYAAILQAFEAVRAIKLEFEQLIKDVLILLPKQIILFKIYQHLSTVCLDSEIQDKILKLPYWDHNMITEW